MLAQHPVTMYRQGAATTPAERTIARIWNLTLDQITDLQPMAADLLRVLAWYAPEDIPTTLVDRLADPPAVNGAVGLLNAYSMITPDPGAGTLSVQRLVQAIARTPDPDDPHRTSQAINRARERATDQLHAALPAVWDMPHSWPAWRILLPHIATLTGYVPTDTETPTT
ncbi:tetratricopeptide repeat protein, partial [Kitasatospora sp. NPDC058263]